MGTCCVATEQSTMISTVGSGFDSTGSSPEIHMEDPPMSRTHQYRKVMKPLLERKRRARINKCLDNLKDLMVTALQSEGESITKLEKADVLELTVRHLQKLKRQQQLQANPALDMDRYRSGYTACVSEVSRFLTSVPAPQHHLQPFGNSMMAHLTTRLHQDTTSAVRPSMSVSPVSDNGYNSGRDSMSPLSVGSPSPKPSNHNIVHPVAVAPAPTSAPSPTNQQQGGS